MQIIGHFGTHKAARHYCGLCPRVKPWYSSAAEKAEHLRLVHSAQVLKQTDGFHYVAVIAR